MRTVRIFIVDDNFVARRGLRSVIEANKEFTVIGEASTGSEAISKLKMVEADVVLMDIRMPGVDGIDATARISLQNPGAKVLVLTVVDEPVVLANVINAGACGYLVYGNFEPKDLLEAIKSSLDGKMVGIPAIPGILHPSPDSKGDPVYYAETLTQREKEVLRLIAIGKENREIARELSIEEKTVKNHINSIYSKLNIATRQEAVMRALQTRIC